MVTSKDLRECYVALLKLQEACGCNIDRRIKNNDCRTIECEFNEDRQCPIQALKHTILKIEIERSMNALADSLAEFVELINEDEPW